MTNFNNLDINQESIDNVFQDFIDKLINAIEIDIIPEIINDIQLPPLPTKAEILGYNLRKDRIPKIAKKIYNERHPYKKSLFIQELVNLKQQLNGHKASETSLISSIEINDGNSQSYFQSVQERQVNLKELFFQNIDFSKFSYKKVGMFNTSIDELPKIKKEADFKFFIQFDRQLEKEVIKNEKFMKFINQIEISTQNFSHHFNLDCNCILNLEQDFEIQDLEKITLILDIENKSIQEKLDLWDQIDTYIRNDLNFLIKHSDESSMKEFSNFNDNLFTEIILNPVN